ncbi:hypothetical protein SAMN05877809_11522 [Rhodobacter sp. JA431]|nr:hypothetical protein SAMN05877809_11522 [Rhodobacter sp. JA431]
MCVIPCLRVACGLFVGVGRGRAIIGDFAVRGLFFGIFSGLVLLFCASFLFRLLVGFCLVGCACGDPGEFVCGAFGLGIGRRFVGFDGREEVLNLLLTVFDGLVHGDQRREVVERKVIFATDLKLLENLIWLDAERGEGLESRCAAFGQRLRQRFRRGARRFSRENLP